MITLGADVLGEHTDWGAGGLQAHTGTAVWRPWVLVKGVQGPVLLGKGPSKWSDRHSLRLEQNRSSGRTTQPALQAPSNWELPPSEGHLTLP